MFLTTEDGGLLQRAQASVSGNLESNVSANLQLVAYVYVDRDVTVSGAGVNETFGGIGIRIDGFNIALVEGWNAVRVRAEGSVNMPNEVASVRVRIDHAHPNLNWVLLDEELLDSVPLSAGVEALRRGELGMADAHSWLRARM